MTHEQTNLSYRDLAAFLAEYTNDLIVTINVPSALMDFVDDENVDDAMRALTEDARTFVREWLFGSMNTPPDQLIHIFAGSNLAPYEHRPHPRKAIAMAALRGWLERHPQG